MSPPSCTRHLDLGCGSVPRNPYRCDELVGIDLGPGSNDGAIRQANLALQPIPFPDDHFDSVSAYDFLEHVPRVLPTTDGSATRLPFVELMDEIWRVLRPGGLFYASTPVYPAVQVFQDPTHVNVLTVDTYVYFTLPQLAARPYGFRGAFRLRRQELCAPDPATLYFVEPQGWRERMRHRRRLKRGEYSHVAWELEAVKAEGAPR